VTAFFFLAMLKVDIQSFSYSEKEILTNISFSLKKGEHLAVLGESGCGKSTLLHLIYGTLHLEHREIIWNNQKLLGPTHNLIPGEGFMKLLAQEMDLMPFISVAENIAEHLPRLQKEKENDRVDELLQIVDLSAFKHRKVKELSGGQKQRVSLARALAKEPEVLLLDEPFISIDSFLKNTMRRTLYAYLKKKNITCITATHDAEEALSFSDTILILKEGTIDSIGTPEKIYKERSSIYQARFFGDVTVLPSSIFSSKTASEELLLLPHQLGVSEEKTMLEVTVTNGYFKGNYYLIEGLWNKNTVFFQHDTLLKSGDTKYLKLT